MKCVAVVLLSLATIGFLRAQSFYIVSKNQHFVQTSAAGVAAEPLAPFSFRAHTTTSATLTLPDGSTAALSAEPRKDDYRLDRKFATKAALDAAFPNGTYRMTGAAIPTLSLNLAADNYPSTTPQLTSVTNGAWNSGGVLVVNPAQSVTLNFNTFSGYATSGVAGLINFYFGSMTNDGNDRVQLEVDTFSQPIFGAPALPPLTTYTIPAGRLLSGRVYRAWLEFDTVSAIDTTSVAGSAVGAVYSKDLSFWVAAQSPGTSTPPPVIVTQPASRTAVIGGSATFTVDITAGGTREFNMPFSFNWSVNGREIDNDPNSKYLISGGSTGGMGFNLTINSLTAADAGDYAVTIVTAGGIATSSPATLSFATSSAPAITAQPRGATVNAGTTVALTVAVTGTPTPSYQWRKDGSIVPGGTADTLVLSNIAAANAGNYTVVVSNPSGTITSNAAAVNVTSDQPSQLPNLSVRTNLATGQTLFVGFSTIGSKTMLVRAVGPTLAGFGLTGTHPDPVVELYNSGAVKIDENNDWNSALTTVFASNGAFPLLAGSKDAALQRACSGAYTAQIRGAGTGVVLVEAYDTGGTGKLMNVSARNQVGTDDNILMAGFVVQGGAAKTLLIRGVGAKLAEFGVSGVLADPKLEIYTGAGVKIAENDNWNALLQSVARSVGAFDLTPNSRDAALLMTLAPGDYTAQISGIGRTTGEALVEVYEVP
ncbi:MAG: immunoglobulin domain-containing protein [Opitutaceae bacterium]|nr:immunoglobulin domain-containing protein [Opitutaceae bacterium]